MDGQIAKDFLHLLSSANQKRILSCTNIDKKISLKDFRIILVRLKDSEVKDEIVLTILDVFPKKMTFSLLLEFYSEANDFYIKCIVLDFIKNIHPSELCMESILTRYRKSDDNNVKKALLELLLKSYSERLNYELFTFIHIDIQKNSYGPDIKSELEKILKVLKGRYPEDSTEYNNFLSKHPYVCE